MKIAVLGVLALGCAGGLFAETISVRSPDDKNEIRLLVEESLRYAVLRNGQVRIAPTPLSMTVENRGVLGAKPVVAGKRERAVAETILTPVYKKAAIHAKGHEVAVRFEGGYQVILRAHDDGVAYRFATALGGTIKVADEQAALTFPSPDLIAYVGYNWGNREDAKQDKLQNSWESIYEKMKVSEVAADKQRLVYLPLLLQYPDGACVCVTESDLLDYPGWNLYRDGKDAARLSPWMARVPVSRTVEDNQRHVPRPTQNFPDHHHRERKEGQNAPPERRKRAHLAAEDEPPEHEQQGRANQHAEGDVPRCGTGQHQQIHGDQ